MPTISVIIPTYNAAPFLREALDSLLAQTFTDWEAVCVNDGSTDNSLEILQEYAARDPRFRILDGPNGGYGKAMNRGMDAAQGEYMAILEPDDILPPRAYEHLLAMARIDDLDIAKGAICIFHTDENGVKECSYFPNTYLNRAVFAPIDNLNFFRCKPNTVSALYRMAYLRKNHVRYNETPGASYQDNGFFLISGAYARRVKMSGEIVYMYRQDNPNSSINMPDSKMYLLIDEFKLAGEKLAECPEVWEKFKPAYVAKFVTNHIWMFGLIRESRKLEFLRRIREEVFIPFEKEDWSVLMDWQREWLADVLQSPEMALLKFSLRPELDNIATRLAGNANCPQTTSAGFGLFSKYNTPQKTVWKVLGIPVITRTRGNICTAVIDGAYVPLGHADIYRVFGFRIRTRETLGYNLLHKDGVYY